MIFNFVEIKCTLQVLEILEKRKTRYSVLFKKTKVSHTTLQKVLKDLLKKKFILKKEEGYKINEKGKKFLRKLEELKEILK